MVTGATSAWGFPINAVGGQIKTMLQGDHPLTYEESLTSYYPKIVNGEFQSPLLRINSFGKKKNKTSSKQLNILKSDLKKLILI